jgi:hypothetical protein
MTISINKRWRWWLLALGVTLLLVVKGYLDDPEQTTTVVAATSNDARHDSMRDSTNETHATRVALEHLQQTRNVTDTADLFRPKSWYVAPPPQPAPPPPVAIAPPLPYTFIGKVEESDGKLTLFLSDQNRVYLVHGGETLGNTYHVDGIENGKLAMTYLPLKKKQYLNLVEAH